MNRIKIENIIIIVLALVLVVIIALIFYLNGLAKEKNKEAVKESAKKIERVQKETKKNQPKLIPTRYLQPTIVLPDTNIIIKYDEAAEYKLHEKIINRTPLSENDDRAISEIADLLLMGRPDDLPKDVNIEFNTTLKMFEVEIGTTNFDITKMEAVNWFKNHGMSQNAICSYPIEFYVSRYIFDELKVKALYLTHCRPIVNSLY